ncbi:MAG: bifunctional DNA primase/polymerase [Xanthobacteraceae bacterium]
MRTPSIENRPSAVKLPVRLLAAYPQVNLFPITAAHKAPPCFKHNLELASGDPAVLAQWAARYPGCNWGISLAKSGLIVMDVDTKPGKRGAETLQRLELLHGPLPPTLTVRTPSGGLHYYFTETANVRHVPRTSAFGPDIDSTNYVVAPGAVTIEGPRQAAGRYQIMPPTSTPIAPAPAWFSEYLVKATVGDNSAAGQIPAVDLDQPQNIAWAIQFLKRDAKPAVQNQNGESTAFAVAARLKDVGISKETAITLMAEHYNERCEPPWSFFDGPIADRLDVKIGNAWNYAHQTQPGALSAGAAFADDPIDAAALDAIDAWWKARPEPPRPKLTRLNSDGMIETRKHTRSANPLPIVRSPRHDR